MRFLSMLPLLLLATALGCATAAPVAEKTREGHQYGNFTKHYAESHFIISDAKSYSVEMIVLEGELKKGSNKVDIILHDRTDADVMGAAVVVTPWMPDMGHGVFEKPLVTERGGGLYSVENIVLSMSGKWVLRVRISADAGEDVAVFEFPDVGEPAMHHDHGRKHGMMTRPETIDTATTAKTAQGVFQITYTPKSTGAVPINRVQKWTLHVETPDGKPVTDATISVEGEMPEHGHGLPTKPRVTKNLGNGDYLVDGMKFQMPGWWVVTFGITSNGKEDTATFNLNLK